MEGHSDAHARLGLLGNVSLEAALDMKFERLGRRVKSIRKTRELPALNAAAKSIERNQIKEMQRQIRDLKSKDAETPSKKLFQIRARFKLLRKLRRLGESPHASQLAAALAYTHGLERERLLPVLSAADALGRHFTNPGYLGDMTDYLKTTRENFPALINDLLHGNAESFTTDEIAARLGLNPAKKNLDYISKALGLLDLMKLAYKLPDKGDRTCWTHACHEFRPITLPHWNLDYALGMRLLQGKRQQKELATPGNVFGKTFGSSEGLSTFSSINHSVNRLRQAGLVKTESVMSGRAVELTKLGRAIFTKQSQSPHLIETLRSLLIGLPRELGEPKTADVRMFERIKKWAEVKQGLVKRENSLPFVKKTPYAGINKLARDLGVSRKTLRDVIEGKIPWNRATPKKLNQLYLPWLRREHPELATLFEAEINRLKQIG